MNDVDGDLDYNPPNKRAIQFRDKTTAFLVALLCLVFILTLLLSQLFAWNEVSKVRDRLNETIQDREQDEAKEDCRNLYTGDLIAALGESQVDNNNMWISVGSREAALSDEDRVRAAEENQRLVMTLDDSNTLLTSVVNALRSYESLSPTPTNCPHPAWDSSNEPDLGGGT